jgi:FlaA1/EpsC-like NDP-sugar epimerase
MSADSRIMVGRRATALWIAFDVAAVFVAVLLGSWIRYDLDIPDSLNRSVVTFALLAGVLQIFIDCLSKPFRRTHRRGSFEETSDLARNAAVLLILLVVLRIVSDRFPVPRSIPAVAPVFALLMMFAARYAVRSYRWGQPGGAPTARRVIVFGAGEGGHQLIRALNRDPEAALLPVAVLDDDPRKRRWRVEGVRVRGGRGRLRDIAAKSDAQVLAIAVPSAEAELLRELRDLAMDSQLQMLVLPPVSKLLTTPTAGDLREINLEDLLGRQRIELDDAAIAEIIRGRRVLVTGAGGSIGAFRPCSPGDAGP